MIVKTLVVTPFQQNARIIIDSSTKKAAIVDPGGDVAMILAEVEGMDIEIESILITHSHIDHVAGVSELIEILDKPSIKIYGCRIEQEMRSSISTQALMFGLPAEDYRNCPEPTNYLEDGDKVSIGELEAEVIFAPGHSPGHLAFHFAEHSILIAGDTLFQGSIGRTDLPGGDHQTLINSIKQRIFSLPDNTVVMSGHGADTNIATEKESNPFLQ